MIVEELEAFKQRIIEATNEESEALVPILNDLYKFNTAKRNIVRNLRVLGGKYVLDTQDKITLIEERAESLPW